MSDYDPEALEKATQECDIAAKKYAECVHQRLLYEHRSKDYLAALKMEIRQQPNKLEMSEAELETRARASEDWKKFREVEMKKLQEAGRREIQWREKDRKWRSIQSLLAMRREEVKRIS